MTTSRRAFLQGLLSSAAIAAVPVAVLPPEPEFFYMVVHPNIAQQLQFMKALEDAEAAVMRATGWDDFQRYQGQLGAWQGITIREG